MVLFKKQGSVSETVADSAAIDLEDGATKEKNIVVPDEDRVIQIDDLSFVVGVKFKFNQTFI